MAIHTHNFVEDYKGPVGFGFDRKTDENTIIYYLQKFSEDKLMEEVVEKLADAELDEIFSLISRLLKQYLTESEYHRLFLKEDHP